MAARGHSLVTLSALLTIRSAHYLLSLLSLLTTVWPLSALLTIRCGLGAAALGLRAGVSWLVVGLCIRVRAAVCV